jgi:hypothetical protein
MALPVVYEDPDPPASFVFFRARLVANRKASTSDATVKTPPTIAHVLRRGSKSRRRGTRECKARRRGEKTRTM